MNIIKNNILQTGQIALMTLLLLSCDYTNNGEINTDRDYDSADLRQIAHYKADDFISSFLNSSFLMSQMNEDSKGDFLLASVIMSDNRGLYKLFKFKTTKVTGYNVEYNTVDPYDGGEITASGLLLVPSLSKPPSLLMYHRSSLLNKEAAPSLAPETMLVMDPITDERAVMIMLAMQGYIVIAPDYTGYGASDDIRHPYLHKKSVTQTSLDMLFSSVETLKDKDIPFKNGVSVMGYSQGAHGAMAFAQGLQDSRRDDLPLKIVSAGGGPYDVSATIKGLFEQDSINQITTLLFMQSYSHIYSWDLDDILTDDSYKDIIESSFEYEDITKPAKKMPKTASALFQSQFIDDIQNDRKPAFQKNLEENNVYEWAPSAPVFLFHARNDSIVPYSNMQKAQDSFNQKGSTRVVTKDCNFKRFNSFLRTAKMLNRGDTFSMPEPDHINCAFIFALEASDYMDTQ